MPPRNVIFGFIGRYLIHFGHYFEKYEKSEKCLEPYNQPPVAIREGVMIATVKISLSIASSYLGVVI